MSSTRALRAPNPLASLLVTLALAACGGTSVPAAVPLDSPPPAPPPSASPTAGPDAAAIESCLATAGAKRARSTTEPTKVGIKHVLVKYKGSKNAKDDLARSREQACLRAMEARDKLRGGADFSEIVNQYSDEPGAASREGSMGVLERKELVKPFADAAFELSVHQMSDVVETEFGFHLILRTE